VTHLLAVFRTASTISAGEKAGVESVRTVSNRYLKQVTGLHVHISGLFDFVNVGLGYRSPLLMCDCSLSSVSISITSSYSSSSLVSGVSRPEGEGEYSYNE